MKELIVITGASSGIGEATAKLFLEKGHSLLLLARRVEKLERFKKENVLLKKVDVTDLESFKKAVFEGEERFGPTQCLVNNAGLLHTGPIQTQDPKEWKEMLDVNVMGLLNGMHIVLPNMVKRKSGTIINISSVAGRKAFPTFGVYCGTKFAVQAITEAARLEVAENNVRVILISPGAVDTEIFSHGRTPEARERNQNFTRELSGMLQPETIAEAILTAYTQPPSTCIREMIVAPTTQSL